jgi:hypothetical protein
MECADWVKQGSPLELDIKFIFSQSQGAVALKGTIGAVASRQSQWWAHLTVLATHLVFHLRPVYTSLLAPDPVRSPFFLPVQSTCVHLAYDMWSLNLCWLMFPLHTPFLMPAVNMVSVSNLELVCTLLGALTVCPVLWLFVCLSWLPP